MYALKKINICLERFLITSILSITLESILNTYAILIKGFIKRCNILLH